MWAERGFDGCTLARSATHADVHPTAIYDHIDSRDELLYAVAVRALDQLTEAATLTRDGRIDLAAIAATYLEPNMSEAAADPRRDPRRRPAQQLLAELLSAWHLRWADTLIDSLPATRTRGRPSR